MYYTSFRTHRYVQLAPLANRNVLLNLWKRIIKPSCCAVKYPKKWLQLKNNFAFGFLKFSYCLLLALFPRRTKQSILRYVTQGHDYTYKNITCCVCIWEHMKYIFESVDKNALLLYLLLYTYIWHGLLIQLWVFRHDHMTDTMVEYIYILTSFVRKFIYYIIFKIFHWYA